MKGILLTGGFGTRLSLVTQMYMQRSDLNVELLGPEFGCLEEIGSGNGWLSDEQVMQTAKALSKNSYEQCLVDLLDHNL